MGRGWVGAPVAEASEGGEDEDAVQNESDGQRIADAQLQRKWGCGKRMLSCYIRILCCYIRINTNFIYERKG